MLTVEEALARCLAAARPVVPERVSLVEAFGRVLVEPLISSVSLPPWDNSAMDGFAVRAADLCDGATSAGCCDAPRATGDGVVLRVLETIAAGAVGQHRVEPGTTSRIMTGAPLPEGADAVVMREDSEAVDETHVRLRGSAHVGQHLRRAGSEVRPGDLLLPAGDPLTPAAVGVAASAGQVDLLVARRPRVAVIATGDEIVAPGAPRQPGQIWSSNSLTLLGLVREAGAEPVDCGIAPDTLEGTRAAFRRALDCDFILSTGGVSVGDFDVVKEALAAEGAEMRFWKVRMKPGKPLAFGLIGGKPAFGLPGNPVSCVVNFFQFVRPVLRVSLGDRRPYLPVVDAVFRGELRRSTGREELVRVTLSWEQGRLTARSTGAQGSDQLTSLARGHGLMLVGRELASLDDGATVAVQLIADAPFRRAETPDYRW